MEWARDPRYADVYGRHENRQELDQHIAAWTINYTHCEVMDLLQSAGVAAMPSFCASEILSDPHILEREVVTTVDHPMLGKQYVLNPPWKLSETPARIYKSAPCMGEHNHEVFVDFLGVPEAEYQDMIERKVIY